MTNAQQLSCLLATVLLVSCASGSTGGGSTTSSSSSSGGGQEDAGQGGPDAGGAQVPGCGLQNVATGLQAKDIMVGGVNRHYQLFVPATYDAAVPTRLIFVFHGLGGDGTQIRAYFGFEAQAAGQALFVYPDGLVRQQGNTGWAVEDMAFVDAMLEEVSNGYCVDRARVFATGHSFGAYMTNQVGCERGNVVRAIAAVSGGLLGGTCTGPVAAWVAHGNADSTVDQSEGMAARDHWVQANSCASTTMPTLPSPCVAYDGCSAGHPTTWCSFDGGHYPLPAFIKGAIWEFFAAF